MLDSNCTDTRLPPLKHLLSPLNLVRIFSSDFTFLQTLSGTLFISQLIGSTFTNSWENIGRDMLWNTSSIVSDSNGCVFSALCWSDNFCIRSVACFFIDNASWSEPICTLSRRSFTPDTSACKTSISSSCAVTVFSLCDTASWTFCLIWSLCFTRLWIKQS